MRPVTEKKFVYELIKTNDAAKAAYELLTNGTQLSTKDKEELEQKLFKNILLCIKYKTYYRPGHWPEFVKLMQTTEFDTQHYDNNWSSSEHLDYLLLIEAYASAKGKQ